MADSRATPRRQKPRSPVSVVVPFRGGRDDVERLLDGLLGLHRDPEDELIVADNTDPGLVAELAPAEVVVVHAPDQASAYYARNVGAESARNEWLLFTDADCLPSADLLDAYFAVPVDSGCGALAGEVLPEGDDPMSRYAATRFLLSQRAN